MKGKLKRVERLIEYDARNPSKNKLHVIPSRTKGWAIVSDGKVRAFRIFPSKQNAITFAKNYLDDGEIEIHNSDGTIDSNITIRK